MASIDELLEGVELPAVVRRSSWEDEHKTWTVYFKAAGAYYGKYTSGGIACYTEGASGFEFPAKPKIKLYRGVGILKGVGAWFRTKEEVANGWDYVQTIEVEER